MRVQTGFHVEWVDDEAVVLNEESGELHYLNPPAALIYALVQEAGYPAVLTQLRDRYPDQPNLEEEVDLVIQDMVSKGLLIDD